MDVKNGNARNINGNGSGSGRGYNKEKPPEDDCCPICFGEFKVPCKANCGHWFCGSCVLQLWKYRARPRRCKCTFCSSAISHLTPEASVIKETQFEVVEILENIDHYNRFYVKGAKGFFLAWAILTSVYFDTIASTSPDSNNFTSFPKERALISLLRHPEESCSTFTEYNRQQKSMVKRRQDQTIYRFISILLVIFPYTLIICKTWVHILWLRFCIWQVRREVDALHAHSAILREQEAALRERADVLREQETVFVENIPLQEKDETNASSQTEANTALKADEVHVEAVLAKRDSNALQEEQEPFKRR